MKNQFSILAAMLLLGTGCVPQIKPQPVACTMEAKLCPDGSYVGRTGPKCEFAPCPTVSGSGIEGQVLLGPNCPVQRIPPDPNCADRPYQATVSVQIIDGQEIMRFTTGTDGNFKVNLAPGNYLLVPVSAKIYPRGITQTVVVEKDKFTEVTISFDSGIR